MQVTLMFNEKKDFSKFMRNYRNGKGTVIRNDMVQIVDGDMSGDGFGSILRKAAKSKAGKSLLKKGAQLAANEVAKRTGNESLGQAANLALNAGVDEYTSGQGLGSLIKRAARSGIGRQLTKTAINAAANEVSKRTGNQALGDASKILLNEGANKATSGNGVVKRGRKKKIEGGSPFPLGRGVNDVEPALILDNIGSLGGRPSTAHNPSVDMTRDQAIKDKMAHVRSFRRKSKK